MNHDLLYLESVMHLGGIVTILELSLQTKLRMNCEIVSRYCCRGVTDFESRDPAVRKDFVPLCPL